MKGNLSTQTLAELIREISGKDLSGTLRLEHERAQAAVYFDQGEVVFAASNLKTLRLREYLIKLKKISEDHETLQSNLSDDALAFTLTKNGIVSQEDIDALMTVLVRDVLRVALLWTSGTWEFNERARLAAPVRVKLDIAPLLREAAQRWPANFVLERLRNASETISRGVNISRTSSFQPAESFILSRLDKPMKLGDLVSESGLPELSAHRVIYGLALSGLVEREYWQNAFRSDPAKPPKDSAASSDPTQPQRSDNWLAASVENEDLEEFLTRQRAATNHYEVIELTPDAKLPDIKNAYYAMARRYHPDRFHLKYGTKLHAEISSVFARITQAYETLANPETRATYDQTLERIKRLAEPRERSQKEAGDDYDEEENLAAGARADQCFREGFAALEQGRLESATKYLATAARLQPQEARYRAYFGRALAANAGSRRLAETELQTAVKIEPDNLLFRTMLAELYFDLKFYRRAQTEINRVLAVDSRDAMANLLLRKLEKSSKVG